ncbi:MAG: riboflavin synthase [Dehalococcoidia bacterium]
MFTGIIEEVGAVLEAGDGVLRIGASLVLEDTKLGDSIAINGVDLTVAEITDDSFSANVMPETYRRSNLGSAQPGERVNLERSLHPGDRLSGHIVRGVVEGTGRLKSLKPEADAVIATYDAPPELLPYVVVKGPIAVDGASLTVIQKTERTFTVSLVQYTQQHTNLMDRKPGDAINLETDILARYVGELLADRGYPPRS